MKICGFEAFETRFYNMVVRMLSALLFQGVSLP